MSELPGPECTYQCEAARLYPSHYTEALDPGSGLSGRGPAEEERPGPYGFCCPPQPGCSYGYPDLHIISNHGPLTWGPEYEISSMEVCEAVSSINPHGAEDKQHGDASQVDLGQSSDYTLRILLPPDSRAAEQSAAQTSNMHQVVCDVQDGGPIIRPHGAAQHAGADPPVSSSAFLPSVRHLSTPVHPPPGFTFNSVPAQFLSQFHPALCPGRPDAPRTGTEGHHISRASWERSRKPCNCTKSQCLKLYCDCFANGDVCSNCNCVNCCNDAAHQAERYKAIRVCLNRNKEAFRPKIDGRTPGDSKGRHAKGCNCKRSGCLKNYCECYEAKIMCSSTCKCVGCRNYGRSPAKGDLSWDSSHSTCCTSTPNKPRSRVLCITPAVVRATCNCLLAQAEEAEQKRLSSPHAERMILEEYGQCLSEIVSSIFRDSDVFWGSDTRLIPT